MFEARSPKEAEVWAALHQVLASAPFATADRSKTFLKYIVEETLAGRGDRLKGYTVAIAVFERSKDFDAQSDPLVRVEAGRLRRRLAEYYHGAGHDDAVRIGLPRGGYAPTFRYSSSAATVDPNVEPPQPRVRRFQWVTAAATAAVALVGVVWLLRGPLAPPSPQEPSISPPQTSSSLPRVVVVPFTSFGEGGLESFAIGTTDEVIQALVRFNVFTVASPPEVTSEQASLQALRRQFDAGYAVSGSVRAEGNAARVIVRLMETEFGTQLWTRDLNVDLGTDGLVAIEERVGGEVATLLASPFGAVYGHEIQRLAGRAVGELNPYECLVKFYGYAKQFTPESHSEGVRCLRRAVATDPSFAQGWGSLAIIYLHEHLFGYTPQPDREPALARAEEAVRRALDLDGSGRIGSMALANIRLAAGDRPGFELALNRALAITPQHPAVLAQLGYALCYAGDWRRGLPLIEEAIPLTYEAPTWYYAAYAFVALRQHDYAAARDWALKIEGQQWFMAPLLVAASAASAGNTDMAAREVRRLLELKPDFAATGRELLTRWNMDPDLFATLLAGLKLAGLEVQ